MYVRMYYRIALVYVHTLCIVIVKSPILYMYVCVLRHTVEYVCWYLYVLTIVCALCTEYVCCCFRIAVGGVCV